MSVCLAGKCLVGRSNHMKDSAEIIVYPIIEICSYHGKVSQKDVFFCTFSINL